MKKVYDGRKFRYVNPKYRQPPFAVEGIDATAAYMTRAYTGPTGYVLTTICGYNKAGNFQQFQWGVSGHRAPGKGPKAFGRKPTQEEVDGLSRSPEFTECTATSGVIWLYRPDGTKQRAWA